MINVDYSSDLRCPKCHSSNTKRNKYRILSGTRELVIAAFLLIFFGTSHPLLLVITLGLLALILIANLVMWVKFRNYWEMECCRCSAKFYAPNLDSIKNKNLG